MGSPKSLELFLQSFILSTLCVALHQVLCLETDTITFNSSINDPDTIVSPGNIFKFGFFSPENTTNRYLGIFYSFSNEAIVWVANRDEPLTDSFGIATISRDGNLVLLNGKNETIWTTNATISPLMNTEARLLDSGNLVLLDILSGRIVWESFSHPGHVFLPTMKAVKDRGTLKKVAITSWKTGSDPGIGNFTNGLEFRKIPELFIWNNGRPHWRSGPWNGRTFLGDLADLQTPSRNSFRLLNDSSGNSYVTVISVPNLFIRPVIEPYGKFITSIWEDSRKRWVQARVSPDHECDIYGTCGPFGVCNRQSSPICSCLKGFEPRENDEWERGNWTGGCVRRKPLQNCGTGTKDGFLTLQFMKPPDFPEQFNSTIQIQEDECRNRCSENCSCIAHTYDPNIGCMFWSGILVDVQQFPGVGLNLHIRLASSELEHKKDVNLIILIPTMTASVLMSICIFIGCWWRKRKGKGVKNKSILNGGPTCLSNSTQIILIDESSNLPFEGLPLFTLEVLADATNQFDYKNMLGKGGFGLVYKGTLQNGREIAVKRLSSASGQGSKEFKTEVTVISKLQHRNLVTLIGYCVEKGEKMLVYDYMPNKSLDSYLFDGHRSLSPESILSWEKRLSIIEGIGRGLLYLHKDSRLKIIHRDLKPSNVLLDEDWNPKISDFGTARIFSSHDHLDTTRVVGTYGYMAPEYATEGRFSEKSDVFSYGVLVLEIISGKKNTCYYNQESALSFLGHAWNLWKEERSLEFVDQTTMLSSNLKEKVMRCIHVALLCVQELPRDRPDIQTLISMLSGEIVDLAIPEKPVFAEKLNPLYGSLTEKANIIEKSINELTVSVLHGR